ncbi:AAA family ATPase [Burkholderia cenocepacia]|uniref:AAA family ATPase n=1 Tax=Burkholderia cenocepacia TaxID=95486 RepID=UPI0028BB1AC7|nr:AAA family ATPase [Burkholderia cenocepacia]MDT6997667.1 AAA family ATPase [Burkholderia cenocepacia]
MSVSRQPAECPAGFAPLGDLSTIQCRDAWRLLVPQSTRDELAAIRYVRQNAAEQPKSSVDSKSKLAAKEMADQPSRRPKARRVRVFSSEALEQANADLDGADSSQQQYARPLLEKASGNGGYRELPDIRKALKELDIVQSSFANLREPIGKLMVDLTLARAVRSREFRIRPILLMGEPGIGKTHFASKLAQALAVPVRKWSAGSAQASFQLVGGDSGWRQARPGAIFEILAKGDSATPVLILDEVDKIGSGSNYPIVPVLLDLLEADTAGAFYDAFFRMEFDASRIIIVLTANDLDRVPAPLLSRVEVFNVPAPDPEQRMQIILAKIAHLQRSTRKRIELEVNAVRILGERADLDLRQVHRLVVDAFATALTTGDSVATLTLPSAPRRQIIGFAASHGVDIK